MLLVNIFEYRDVFNWTDNVPTGSRMMFIETIGQHIKPDARILELGVKTGISLIAMLFSIPNSTGVAVDTWNKSMKRSFDINVQNAGMTERVLALHTESHGGLLNLYSARESFNVIYLNNSTVSFDCYAEITIAWKLLKMDGLLIVDNFGEIVHQFIDCRKDGTVICQNNVQTFIKKI